MKYESASETVLYYCRYGTHGVCNSMAAHWVTEHDSAYGPTTNPGNDCSPVRGSRLWSQTTIGTVSSGRNVLDQPARWRKSPNATSSNDNHMRYGIASRVVRIAWSTLVKSPRKNKKAPDKFRLSDYVRGCSFEPELTGLLDSWVSTAITLCISYFKYMLQRPREVLTYTLDIFKAILSL